MTSLRKAAAITVMATGALAITACSSTSSTLKPAATPTHTAKAVTTGTRSGMEYLTSTLTGMKALSNSPVFTVSYTGLIITHGTFNVNGTGPKPGQTRSFPTSDGTLTLKVVSVPNNGESMTKVGPISKCGAESLTIIDVSVDGAKSTGKFANATGTGTVDAGFSGDMPKLKSGACNMSENASPVTSTAKAWVTGTIVLTVKKS
jgi:hypothetical protein